MTNLQNAPQSHQQTPQRARRAALDIKPPTLSEKPKKRICVRLRGENHEYFYLEISKEAYYEQND